MTLYKDTELMMAVRSREELDGITDAEQNYIRGLYDAMEDIKGHIHTLRDKESEPLYERVLDSYGRKVLERQYDLLVDMVIESYTSMMGDHAIEEKRRREANGQVDQTE